MSETFTPRCSFGATRRFRISPASYVDLAQTFSRRGFPSLPCLRRCVKYLTNVQSPKEKGRELQPDVLTIGRHFFDSHSSIRVQSSSVNRQAWFIFIGPDWRATISESYITYLHFDDKVSTALARSRHKKPAEVEIQQRCWRWIGHMLRKPATNTTRQALRWNPQGKRKRQAMKHLARRPWRRRQEDGPHLGTAGETGPGQRRLERPCRQPMFQEGRQAERKGPPLTACLLHKLTTRRSQMRSMAICSRWWLWR